ncbi:Gmad2 immunoglobulin-like domain-containing protein [Paenarthrobacter sp. PH39-S1]|uniref:Gmad2 immunoglobulin-like domain-containing protein n=1 Tax=Paenarthrobacter sp. PH39-S1 TaxID=3046204 RepID=UPI0024B91AED|nr:Gmad2 immunoglobulin-like domain-containing protein [Paenarthrobacter sp. PH39-S1]MDJ0357494.1 Gmad2 immunoglobulin-like domain-containing protein [Paenarthrobacter sp. PH39-S1]
MPASAGSSATSGVTGAPLETAQTSTKLPVYWLGHSGAGIYLYREFLTMTGDGDPIEAALLTMTSEKPLDGDYFTPWKKPARLGAAISAKNIITVDISSDAFSTNVDEGIARRALAQLVYTATAAAANAGLIVANQPVHVSLLVDGHTDYLAFGKIKLDQPLVRDSGFVAPVWVIDPQEGTDLGAPFKVSGQGISASGTLVWQLLKVSPEGQKSVFLSGSTIIGTGPGQLGPFEFSVQPPVGSYELRVYSGDPADPADQAGVDSKLIKVS